MLHACTSDLHMIHRSLEKREKAQSKQMRRNTNIAICHIFDTYTVSILF